ncbi:single strand DNA binding protein [Pseudomonas phage vB_PpuM-SKa-4]
MARDSARTGRSRTGGGGSVGAAPARKGFGATNAGQTGGKRVYFNKKVKMIEYPPGGAFIAVRIVGDPIPDVVYSIKIVTPKGEFDISHTPLNFDRDADTFDTTIDCPFAEISNPKQTKKYYYVPVIVRELQDSEPKRVPEHSANEKKTGFVDNINSASWTPVRVMRVTDRIAGKIKKLEDTNKVKTKQGVQIMPLGDPEFGRDILVSYDKDAKSASDMYDVQLDSSTGHTPLSRTEQKYLQWDILGNLDQPMSYADAVKEVASLESKAPDAEDVEEEEEKAGKDLDRGSKRKRESDRPLRGSKRSSSREEKPERTSRREKTKVKADKPEKSGKSTSSRSERSSRTSRDKEKTSTRSSRSSRR